MAQFFKAKPNRSNKLSAKLALSVTQLDHLGAGIAQHQGKVVFVPGALPGETVTAQLTEQKKRYAKAKLIKIDTPSAQRLTPECEFYGQCGGCDLQHMSLEGQREHKQRALAELMGKTVKVENSIDIAPALMGNPWGYRRRARLATYFDKQSKALSLGFRAANSNKVVNISHCKVLSPALSALIAPLSAQLNLLSNKKALGHVELTAADNHHFVVIRVVSALKQTDLDLLAEFATQHQVIVLLQDENGDCRDVKAQVGSADNLNSLEQPQYLLNEGIKLDFAPGNFIQVNGEMNQAMVSQAIDWLELTPKDRVLDLFCGMGNFSLAMAKTGAHVIGVEGVPAMVEQAKANAELNGLNNVDFYHADLSADMVDAPWMDAVDKLLLDPARAGAYEILHLLETMQPKLVVYVSCNPASLSRDACVLYEQGYKLQRVGLIDMFPQTHHIEAIALFSKAK